MNPTLRKFGYPKSLLRELDHWCVLLRSAQVTLGSLVLVAKSDATAYGSLSREVFAEQADAVAAVERALGDFCHYERINYLMLMMVDPHVHFHVIPRYSTPRTWCGLQFDDAGWPGPPRLDTSVKLDGEQLHRLTTELASRFR